jgi:hypothetical protein
MEWEIWAKSSRFLFRFCFPEIGKILQAGYGNLLAWNFPNVTGRLAASYKGKPFVQNGHRRALHKG